MTFKIGVYSRVSTEEQAKVIAGSIQCQVQRCNQFVSAKNQVYLQWDQAEVTPKEDGLNIRLLKEKAPRASDDEVMKAAKGINKRYGKMMKNLAK